MKITGWGFGFVLSCFAIETAAAAQIDPALADFARSNSTRSQRVIALLDPVGANATPPRRYDRARLVSYLSQRSDRAVRALQSELSRRGARGVRIREKFPSSLSVSLDVTPEGLAAVARVPHVVKIYANGKTAGEPPVARRRASRFVESAPYSFETSGLASLIRDLPEYTGKGIVLGQIDTGVDGKHPALEGKIIAFFDGALGKRTDRPHDVDEHGTHTAGTMVGGSRSGSPQIGIAPEAKLVAAGAIGDYEQMLKGMEFMLDPDGNPATNDAPRLVSSSWTSNGAPDQEPFYRAISTWEAAGILPVWSAGNSGPAPRTITRPKEHPEAFAVANAGPRQMISETSSRGPGLFRGQETQKPDLTAPGTDILSAVPGGRYEEMSGTSMAAPHVAGAAGLVLQANPSLNPAQIRRVLIDSSVSLNERGVRTNARKWNPVYGNGHLDIAAAVKLAIKLRDSLSPFPSESRFFLGAESLENDLARGTALRTIDQSWTLVREDARSRSNWLSLEDLGLR